MRFDLLNLRRCLREARPEKYLRKKSWRLDTADSRNRTMQRGESLKRKARSRSSTLCGEPGTGILVNSVQLHSGKGQGKSHRKSLEYEDAQLEPAVGSFAYEKKQEGSKARESKTKHGPTSQTQKTRSLSPSPSKFAYAGKKQKYLSKLSSNSYSQSDSSNSGGILGRRLSLKLTPIKETENCSLVVYFKDFLGVAPPINLLIPDKDISESLRRCLDLAASCAWSMESEDSDTNYQLKQEVMYLIDKDFLPKKTPENNGIRRRVCFDINGQVLHPGDLARRYQEKNCTKIEGVLVTQWYIIRCVF